MLVEYDDKRALIHTHIRSFASLPKRKSEGITELKELRDAVSVALAVLSNLGCPVSQWDHLLVYIISEKFSPKTWTEWNLKRGDTKEYSSYQEINAFLTYHIRGFSDSMNEPSSVNDNSRNKSHSS